MNEGLKRHIKYISLYQGKIFSIIILGGLIYGLFLITGIHETSVEITNYVEMVLAVVPCSLIVNYIRYQIDFCLSMGCTRKNIYLSVYILAAELLAESLAVFLLLRAVTDNPITIVSILSFVSTVLVSSVFGVLNGLLIRRFGYAKMMLVLLLFYVVLAFLALNSFFLISEFIPSVSGALILIGGMLILYGLIVSVFGKRIISRM